MNQSERNVMKYGPKSSPPSLPPLPSPPQPPPPPPLPKLLAYSHQKLFKKCKSATFQLDGATYTIVASPPDRRVTRDDIGVASAGVTVNAAVTGCSSASGAASSKSRNPSSSPGRNGQLSKQGTLTIVRRSSGKSKSISGGNFESSPPPHNPDTSYLSSHSVDLEEILDNVDLTTDSLPAVDTPDACDKAALRLRCLLKQLQHGEISAELLQRNLHYAARVLETVFIDETKYCQHPNDLNSLNLAVNNDSIL